MPGDINPYSRDPSSALPDIYRVKGQYLDSYYNFIDNATTYKLGKHKRRSLMRCQGAVISLYYKLKWEIKLEQRLKIEKLDLGDFEDLNAAFNILSLKLKQLKIIDLKLRPVMGGSFR